jgi:hypothetical protein
MKQNKKGKNYAVFCFAGKKKLLFYIYAVIVKQIFYKRSTNHYLRMHARTGRVLRRVKTAGSCRHPPVNPRNCSLTPWVRLDSVGPV